MRYKEFRFYSPERDERCCRLSVTNDPPGVRNPGEYYIIVNAFPGKDAQGMNWRERREQALTVISEAIDAGCDPGEVWQDEEGYAYTVDPQDEWREAYN